MYVDAQHLFSDAQALTGTAVSTNVYDGGVDRNMGIGEPMAVVVCVDVAADATTGDETYEFVVQTDDSASFPSPENVVSRKFGALPDIPRATLALGYRFVLPLPNDLRLDRAIRVNYVLGGTTPTITVTTFLIPFNLVQAEAHYPKGYTIS